MSLNLTRAAELMKEAKKGFWHQHACGKDKRLEASGMRWVSYTHNILWHMDAYGCHRLIQVESYQGQGFQVGEWAMYESPAILGEFMIFSAYYTQLEEKLLSYRVL